MKALRQIQSNSELLRGNKIVLTIVQAVPDMSE